MTALPQKSAAWKNMRWSWIYRALILTAAFLAIVMSMKTLRQKGLPDTTKEVLGVGSAEDGSAGEDSVGLRKAKVIPAPPSEPAKD